MRFYVLAVTTSDSPDAPHVADSWPVHMIEENGIHGPVMLNRALSEAYAEPDTLTAGVVAVEIPDAKMLPLLAPLQPPTVTGEAFALLKGKAMNQQQTCPNGHPANSNGNCFGHGCTYDNSKRHDGQN